MSVHESADAATIVAFDAVRRSDLAALYQRTHSDLLRRLEAKLGSEQEARDLAHEAYERLMRLAHLQSIDDVRAYLFRVAENLATDRLRERVRRREQENVDAERAQLVSPAPRPERILDGERQIARLQSLLTELPPKCRFAFMMHRFEGLDYREIAERMNLTESMVRKYVLRGLRYCVERFDAIEGSDHD